MKQYRFARVSLRRPNFSVLSFKSLKILFFTSTKGEKFYQRPRLSCKTKMPRGQWPLQHRKSVLSSHRSICNRIIAISHASNLNKYMELIGCPLSIHDDTITINPSYNNFKSVYKSLIAYSERTSIDLHRRN